ncbi:unnamed protein product [Anisakis simplex]|uniref:Ovule protein n=1 Tax=Anisakis simplex TaxID=6269 RepID=A0A0M3KD56_ANISI|nr:unnamed protein product [Anisakis simplex]
MTSTWCSCLRGLTSKRLCGHFSAAPYYSCVPENLLRTKLSVSRTIDPSRKFHPFNLTKSAKFSSSSTATLTPKPSPSFDPDIHFVPSSSSSRNNDHSDVENPSEHEEAEVPSTENLPADWQK